MAQFTAYWRQAAQKAIGAEYDTLESLLSRVEGGKSCGFVGSDKYERIRRTMELLAGRAPIPRAHLEWLDSCWGAEHRREFDSLFFGSAQDDEKHFKAGHRTAAMRFSRWFYPVHRWCSRVHVELCTMIARVVTAKRLGL